VSLPALRDRLARFAADFAAAREWRYGLFTPDGERVLGEMSLFPRDASGRVPYADADHVELGYWLRADMTGRGLVTEAAEAALAVAAGLPSLAQAEIRCDVRNAASAAVPRRLGFVLATTLPAPSVVPGEPPVTLQLWTYALARTGASDA
jgi:RimJ/RimL family protein N-acetyltransferase